MKNLLTLTLVMMVACGDKENEDTSIETEVVEESEETTEEESQTEDTGETTDTGGESEE